MEGKEEWGSRCHGGNPPGKKKKKKKKKHPEPKGQGVTFCPKQTKEHWDILRNPRESPGNAKTPWKAALHKDPNPRSSHGFQAWPGVFPLDAEDVDLGDLGIENAPPPPRAVS